MIRISVFEDNALLRNSLSDFFQTREDFVLAGAYADASNLVSKIEQDAPHLVLMDIGLPKVSGLEALATLKGKFSTIKVVMYTVFDDDDSLFRAICSGADGYVLKSSSFDELINLLLLITQGGAVMTPSIARRVLDHFARLLPAGSGTDYNLTGREKDVLSLLVNGLSYKMIAAELELSLETVRTYVKRTYEKLQVRSVSAAVVKAIKENLV
jgi:DNA-binding NarL/FixJ family response regulator